MRAFLLTRSFMMVCRMERIWRPTHGMSGRVALLPCLGRIILEEDQVQEVKEAEIKVEEQATIEEGRDLDPLAARQQQVSSHLARLQVRPLEVRRGKFQSSQLGLPLGTFSQLQGRDQRRQDLYPKFLGNQNHLRGPGAR